jgi:hypothetical protein
MLPAREGGGGHILNPLEQLLAYICCCFPFRRNNGNIMNSLIKFMIKVSLEESAVLERFDQCTFKFFLHIKKLRVNTNNLNYDAVKKGLVSNSSVSL